MDTREQSGSFARAMARAVSLHLDGKTKEALIELDNAVTNGADMAEIHSARGHVQFELEMYDEAVQSYQRLAVLLGHCDAP